jgi:hypothetical protein
MYLCLHAHISIYISNYGKKYPLTPIAIGVYIYIYIYIYYVYVHILTFLYVYIYVFIYVYMHIYTHTSIYISNYGKKYPLTPIAIGIYMYIMYMFIY